ncbi:LPS export ABC transporter permease LptG [Acidipila sp. EB88]|uniref:LPS export ABC transporter permease LptG n=1 Tax=Acidipila sp. EB88 TaxID=2305226 RepID=UPI000F5E6E15|nr:LPS export ABC transporter permease LptG [Acidipila sp. EB88]RRA47124.1 LPS export ABC transporter permease LptG [Acidipila sp. EB88]
MRILTRYILREITSHALLGGALFTFIFFIPHLEHLLELMVRNASSMGTVLQIMVYWLPSTIVLTVPMAVLVGVLLGFSRLASDSEITSMRACGIGVWSFVRTASIVAFAGLILCLANSLYLAPAAWRMSLTLEDDLRNSQASFEVQPRVFYEDFKNIVLYIDDVKASTGASQWHKIFLADITDANAPRITTAADATVVNDASDQVLMRLRHGAQQQIDTSNSNQYDVSTFSQTDLPLVSEADDNDHTTRAPSPMLAMSDATLRKLAAAPGGRVYQIERSKRFAYPFACLVLMLVGVPLGMSSKRGGKSAGFVLTIALVFIYYFLSSTGIALARQNKVSVVAGVWAANILFGAAGLLLLRRLSVSGAGLPSLPNLTARFRKGGRHSEGNNNGARAGATSGRVRTARSHFPLLLDNYVIVEFLKTFAMVLATFVMLMLLFTFFELLGDIIRNRSPFVVVGEYLLNLTPSMIYLIAPLSVLIAVLVVFGTLNRTNELTAMKATGISVYRVVVPVLVIASLLSVALFAFGETYIPGANRRQEALRAVIKGRPAQTFQRPGEKWMFGIEKAGLPSHIFYYQFFDQDRDRFANISVFTFKPGTFELEKRLFATSAAWDAKQNQWIFRNGWERTFAGDEVASYTTFSAMGLTSLAEQPQYFKKDPRQSSEMSFVELSRYIHDLRQSGFDTMRLRVQLNHKLAYPLITLVMAVLAVPFALSMGRSGSLAGIAVAIGVAIVYWIVSSTLEAMGDVNMLPAFLAAWSPDLLFALAGSYLLLRTPT